MQSQNELSFPELPTELVLHILTFACSTSHETALNISFVSSWVRPTVIPYVFSTVVRRAGPRAENAISDFLPSAIASLSSSRSPVHRTMPSYTGSSSSFASSSSTVGICGPLQGAIRPANAHSLSTKTYSHLLPPTTTDLGQYVRHLWIESIDMMSSPGELNIFNACTNIEDVALAAGSLRVLYNLTSFGKIRRPENFRRPEQKKRSGRSQKSKGGSKESRRSRSPLESTSTSENEDAGVQQGVPPTVGAASHIRSVLLTKHTFRYDWHFLVEMNSVANTHTSILGNITHLRLIDMEKSPYVPLEYLPNLTHLALPYLQLRANHRGDTLRVPDLVLQPNRPTVVARLDATWGEAPSSADRETTPSKLEMIVLTVDERSWLMEPWKHVAHTRDHSPRDLFKKLRGQARARDERLHVVLSPRVGRDYCSEWAGAARGNEDSIWDVAAKACDREEYGDDLPELFPRPRT